MRKVVIQTTLTLVLAGGVGLLECRRLSPPPAAATAWCERLSIQRATGEVICETDGLGFVLAYVPAPFVVEDKPAVDVFLEADGNEIEIDEGPDNGMLSDLRNALEDAV